MRLTPASVASDALTALDLVRQGTPNVDAVAVFNSGLQQCFVNARPLRIDVRERARLMEHPLESGQIISDYKVTLPVEIELPVITQGQFYRGIYAEIHKLFDDSELLTIQTRTASYVNMVIEAMPHEQKPDLFDQVIINLRFKQVTIVGDQTAYATTVPQFQDTTILGYQIGTPYTLLGSTLGLATSVQAVTAQVR